mgnify:CR=1 FL=1
MTVSINFDLFFKSDYIAMSEYAILLRDKENVEAVGDILGPGHDAYGYLNKVADRVDEQQVRQNKTTSTTDISAYTRKSKPWSKPAKIIFAILIAAVIIMIALFALWVNYGKKGGSDWEKYFFGGKDVHWVYISVGITLALYTGYVIQKKSPS